MNSQIFPLGTTANNLTRFFFFFHLWISHYTEKQILLMVPISQMMRWKH